MSIVMRQLLSLLILALQLLFTTQTKVTTNNIHDREGKGDLQKHGMLFENENGCFMKAFTVHIVSDVNDLHLHCQSKDDDLGDVTRNAGEEFDINFCLNFARSTLFFCHFYLESKQRVFDVFAEKGRHDPSYCVTSDHGKRGDCYWLVKEDGFYNALVNNPGPNDWVKKFDWE